MNAPVRFFIPLALMSLVSLIGEGLAGAPRQGGSVGAAIAANPAQEARIAYLKKHAVPVRSLDAADEDFADLEPLREAIGGRRVVMLGEATHGDGATFAAKVRLIKFLHEQMGFDVLAFESGFYDVRRAWLELRAGENPQRALASALFEDWSASRQAQPLWGYIAERAGTDRPLALSGFDMQFTGSASTDFLQGDLQEYLAAAGLPPDAAAAASRLTSALGLLLRDPAFIQNGSPFKNVKPEEQAAILTAAQALAEALGSLPPADEPGMIERDFWIQLLKSSAALMEQSWRINLAAMDKTAWDWASSLRDRQMAENLLWLARRAYPARKIIVWAATSHIIRHPQLLADREGGWIPMGDWIHKAMEPEVYVLGFTAHHGRWGTTASPGTTEVAAADPNSLEGLLSLAGFSYAFLDFRNPASGGAWLREPLSCRPLGHKPMTAAWGDILDGIFFINEMFPSTRTEKRYIRGAKPRFSNRVIAPLSINPINAPGFSPGFRTGL